MFATQGCSYQSDYLESKMGEKCVGCFLVSKDDKKFSVQFVLRLTVISVLGKDDLIKRIFYFFILYKRRLNFPNFAEIIITVISINMEQ